MTHARVVYSTLSAQTLLAESLSGYDIGSIKDCKLLFRNINDTYLVETCGDRYVLRVYRHGWRTRSHISYELEALTHLHRRGCSVSFPIADREGRLFRQLAAPEGERFTALLTYADGRDPSGDESDSYIYGAAVAELHNASQDFKSSHERFTVDFRFLLDEPLNALSPLLERRPLCRSYFGELAAKLKDRLAPLAHVLETGFCHGDTHGLNAHIADGRLCFFDFDYCGTGWRAYDIAAFRWGAGLDNESRAQIGWPAFLKGYTGRRRLEEVDLEAALLLGAVRHIWLMGTHASLADNWGFGWLDDAYFNRALDAFKRWEADHLTRPPILTRS